MSILTILIGLILLCLVGVWACLSTRTLRNRAAFSYAFGVAAVVLTSLPLSVFVTWSISPFWNWVGGVAGVRLVSHAGPALGCYVAVLAVCEVLLGSVGVLLMRLGLKRGAPGGSDEAG